MHNFYLSIDKVKIKYILGTYKSSNNYPTPEDILFLIINDNLIENNSTDLTNITFTLNQILKKFNNCNKENLKKSLYYLLKNNFIKIVKETNKNKVFKIIKNPYLNGI